MRDGHAAFRPREELRPGSRAGQSGTRGLAAIDTINTLVWREQIKCQFEWVPGYLFNPAPRGQPDEDTATSICAKEVALADELGFDAEFVDAIPLFQPARASATRTRRNSIRANICWRCCG